MHLSYRLELPEKPGQVQADLRIAPEASYALSVKNPEKGGPAYARRNFETAASPARTPACSTTRAPSSSWLARAPIRKPNTASSWRRRRRITSTPKPSAVYVW